jgi:L-ascorbate metabolism protein UlaG (beta-lactamase superfamily)
MKINLLTHSSIRVTDNNGRVFYFDPFNIKDEMHDADIIFVTHDHFDHFSIKDINKISKPDTLYILPY